MAKETTYSGKLGDWRRLLESLKTNTADLAYLETPRTELEGLLAQAIEINTKQAIHRAAKQDLSKQLRTLVTEGDRLATLLRGAIKQRYGIRSEKLAEFNLQPFRGITRKPAPSPEEPEIAKGRGTSPVERQASNSSRQ